MEGPGAKKRATGKSRGTFLNLYGVWLWPISPRAEPSASAGADMQFYTEGKPIADKLATIKWKGKREQFMSENENALRLYHMAERKLKPHFKDGKLPITAWRKERDRLEQEYKTGQAELSPIHAEVKKLWQIKYQVEQVIHEQERQNAVTR